MLVFSVDIIASLLTTNGMEDFTYIKRKKKDGGHSKLIFMLSTENIKNIWMDNKKTSGSDSS